MKKYIVLLISLVTMMSAKAETFTFLNCVNHDAEITQVDADGLKITFSDGMAVITVGDQVTTLELSTLDYMEFTNTKHHSSTSGVYGDVNGDGKVDVEDVNATINIILDLKDATDYPGSADLNEDGKVDVEDVNEIININLTI